MKRRSLTHVGGAIDVGGDPGEADRLARALEVAPSADEDAEDRAHVHGFHAYPARAHPVTARRLVEDFVEGTLLDPFAGSGTVMVEGMLAGRDVIGTDLNPIAVMLARAKTFPHPPEATRALVEAARAVSDHADGRRRAKAGASRRLAAEDLRTFAPHVLLELDGIRSGIEQAPPGQRPTLRLVLSSILVKLSAKRGDTSEAPVDKRIAAGYPARLFVKKAEDLARRLDALFTLLPAPPPRARVYEDNATRLRHVEERSIDGIVTSPPYVGTYDYLAHHQMRMRWLGLDQTGLARGELGARRSYAKRGPREAAAQWDAELAALLAALARVARPGAPLVLLIADSALAGGFALRADEAVSRVASRAGEFTAVARASQARPHFHGASAEAFRDRPRCEHALLLRRSR